MMYQAYYSNNPDKESNQKITSSPLIVNCAGFENVTPKFKTQKIRHDYSLMVCTNGMVNLNLLGNIHTLQQNTFIVIEPETMTSYSFNTAPINYYWVHFTGSEAGKILKKFRIEPNTVHTSKITKSITDCFANLFKEFLIKDDMFDTVASSILIQIFSYVSRENASHAASLSKSVEYISNNYNKNITLKELADAENLSVSWFRTVFKQHTGMSPMDYIIMKRIDVACYYLKYTTMSIEAVSAAVGYTNPFYFSKLFKSKLGLSPRQYAKKQNKKYDVSG